MKCVRKIMHIQIDREEDFGEPHHTVHSEPFFYDASYCKVSNKRVIPLNENGKCVIAEPYVIKDEERKDEQLTIRNGSVQMNAKTFLNLK